MKKGLLSMAFVCLLVLFSACNQEDENKNREIQGSVDNPQLSPVSIQSVSSDFRCVDFVIIDQTAFLAGTEQNRHILYCVDLEKDKKEEISLPIQGSLFDLSASDKGLCLATVYSAQQEGTDPSIGRFTLFEIGTDSAIRKQTELRGINKVNLLAIGGPIVNGCAKLGDDYLIIVNNRVFFLDKEGGLLNYLVWDSGHPAIAGCFEKSAVIYDVVDNSIIAKRITVMPDDTMEVNSLELPDSTIGVVPSYSEKGIFIVENKTLYCLDYQTRRQKTVCTFPYGYSKDKDYYFNGLSTLLECYYGRVGAYSIG